MAVSIPDFWRLAVESRLLAAADCDRLNADFAAVKGAASQSNAVTLGEWLVAGGALTRYQARTLLAGQAGPFFYGDYYVYDRIRSKEGRLAGLMRAMHMPTRHPVLLYFITGPAAKDPQWWQVAVQQVAWACSVGHPFVAQCYQLLELGRYKVVASEDLLGDPTAGGERPAGAADSTLAARLTPGARLAPADACRVAYQIGLGLARLQQLGQVHGSIRPENIWLAADGSAKLLQVPLAPEPATGPGPLDWTAADPNGRLSLAADYAAPELAQLGRPPDMCSDVYALGATLYQMLSGWPPFPGGDVASKLSRHASEFPPSLEPFGAPQQVDQLVGYLLAKDPAGRYQSAAQVAEALAYFVDPAVASYVPPCAATSSAYDLWLDTQSRVPGMAAGAIPTASSLAVYSAQYEAAQNGAAQNGAPLQAAGPDYMAAPAAQQVPEQAPSFFDSIQPTAPNFDPTSFAGADMSAPQPEFADWGAAVAAPQQFAGQAGYAAGPYAATQPAGGGAAVAETMPAVAAAAPAGLNLDAILNSAPSPVKSKSRRPSSSAATKAKLSPIALAGLGGGLAVVAVVVGLILFRALSGGTDDNGQVALDTSNGATTRSTSNGTNDGGKTVGQPGTTDPATVPGKVTGNIGDPGKTLKAPPARSSGSTSGGNQPPVVTVQDDGISLWASPTSGPPLPTDYIASGAQLILAVRPANILHDPDGDRLLPSLGPWGDMAAHAVKDATGLDLSQIDQVLLVIHDGGDGKPVATAIFRTCKP